MSKQTTTIKNKTICCDEFSVRSNNLMNPPIYYNQKLNEYIKNSKFKDTIIIFYFERDCFEFKTTRRNISSLLKMLIFEYNDFELTNHKFHVNKFYLDYSKMINKTDFMLFLLNYPDIKINLIFLFGAIKYTRNNDIIKKIMLKFDNNEINKYKCQYDSYNYYGTIIKFTLLHLACLNCLNIKIIKLLSKIIDIKSTCIKHGNTSLHYLAINACSNHNLVDLFRECVNIKNNNGDKPLILFAGKFKRFYSITKFNMKFVSKLIRYTNDNETKIRSLVIIISHYVSYVLKVQHKRYMTVNKLIIANSKIYYIINIFVKEKLIMNNKILDRIPLEYSFVNNIIKLLIKNGFSINKKLKVNEQLQKYYSDFLETKSKIIYKLGFFNKDIISIIIQY